MHNTLTIPQHSDPVARLGLVGFVVVLIYLAVAPGSQIATPQTADAAAPIIAVVEQAPTAAPAGGQATMQAQAPQTEEPGSALVHNPDGSVTLPGSEDWLPPAADVETQDVAAPNPFAVDPAVYKALPVAGQLTESNQQPNYARRPSTGR